MVESGNPRVFVDVYGGLWYILVVVDVNNDVEEIEEDNNVFVILFIVDVDMLEVDFLDLVIEFLIFIEEWFQFNV